jgi:hypothetical protein
MLHYPKEAADDDFAKAMDSALAQVTEHFKDSIMSFQVKQPNVNYPYPIYYKEGEKPN